MHTKTLSLAIAALLLLEVSCALRVPFDPTLVNSTTEVAEQPCGYPRSPTSSITLNADSLTYRADISNENRGPAYNGRWYCPGRADLYYRHRPKHMWIEVIPTAYPPLLRDPATGRPLDDQPPNCSEHQTKQVYWGWGESRPGFEAELRKMFEGAKNMKSSGPECMRRNDGGLDAAISYLYAVAYDYYVAL